MLDIFKKFNGNFPFAVLVGVLVFSGSQIVSVAHADSIAFVTSTNYGANSVSSASFNFTTGAASNTLICASFYLTVAQPGNVATFDGNSMTVVGEATNGAQMESLFCYPNGTADNSSHTIQFSWGGNHGIRARAVEYSGVAQSGYLGAVSTGTTTGTSYTINLDASSGGKWAIAGSGDAGCAQYTNGGNATERVNNATAGDGGGIYRHIIDSNGNTNSTLTDTGSASLCGAYAGGVFSPFADAGAPSIGSLAQYKSDSTSTIGAGSSTTENEVVLKALLSASSSDALQLQVEVQPSSTSFTNVPTATSTITVTSGNVASAIVSSLANGSYHWQARALNTNNNATSSWQSFGGPTDFVVNYTLPSGGEISDGSLQALYHFNDQALTDSSGKSGRNGVQGGTPFLFTTTSTKLGAAAGNDQGSGFFTATSTILDLSGDFTIGFWMQPKSSLSGGAYFIFRNTSSINNNTGITYAISCNAGHLEFVHNGACKIDVAQTFNTNSWYWILMERQGSHLDAYVGDPSGPSLSLVQSATDSLTAQSSTVDVRFNGAAGGSGTGNLIYDEVFFTNAAISTSTRDALWYGGTGKEVCTTVGCGNNSLSLSLLHQYKSDATSTLNQGSSTPEFTVFFGANVSSDVTSTLQIEAKSVGTAFTGTPTVTSTPVSAGASTAMAHVSEVDGSYHWQARVVDINNNSSSWQVFGANTSSTDFVIDRNPIVIIPGITGSILNRASDTVEIWPDAIDMIASPSDNYLDVLKLTTSTDQTVAMEAGDIIREESLGGVEKKFYGNLIDLLSALGYEEGSKLFVAPYDWRFGVASSAVEIAPLIQNAINHSSDGKIDIIAHSMGGLVAKEYLNTTSTSFMNKLILAGVPEIGAPRIFDLLNYGNDLGLPQNWTGFFGLNPDKAKEISQNMPGAYDLLPSRPYIDLTGGYVSSTAGLLNYDDTNTFMTSSTDPRNSALLSRSDSFHQIIDTKQFGIASSSVYNIMGCNRPTIGQFNVGASEVDITAVSGDKDVPLTSANYLSAGYNNYFIAPASSSDADDHLGLVRDDESLKLIWDVLDNQLSVLPQYVATASSSCFDINPFLIISTHSPVELNVYDSQGRHVGPNHEKHKIDFEIPGSSYDVITHNDFAIVPAGENYRIVVDSVGVGTFNLDIEKYSNKFQKESKVAYLSIPVPGTSTTAEADITPTNITPMLNVNMGADAPATTPYGPTTVTNFEVASSSAPPSEIESTSLDQAPAEGPTSSGAVIEPTSTTNDFSLPGTSSSFLGGTSTPIFTTSSKSEPSSSLLEDTSTIIEATSSDILPDAATSSIDSTTTQESVSWWQRIVAFFS